MPAQLKRVPTDAEEAMRKSTFLMFVLLATVGLSQVAGAQGLPVPEANPNADVGIRDKGWLGVGLTTTPVGGVEMVAVENVFKGSPAESSGILPGDIILAFQGADVKDIPGLVAAVGGTKPASKVVFKLRRGTKDFEVPLLLAIRPDRLDMLKGQFLGKPAPPFEVATRAKGPAMTRESLAGKVVVIDFWATWCGPCRATIPRLNALHKKYGKKGVVVLGVTDEDRATVDAFLKGTKIKYPIGLDGEGRGANKAFFVQAYPTLLLMDQKGVIREVYIGASEGKMDKLEARIEELLKP
jgi:thiol-disulfide isomerase/thioredoxin